MKRQYWIRWCLGLVAIAVIAIASHYASLILGGSAQAQSPKPTPTQSPRSTPTAPVAPPSPAPFPPVPIPPTVSPQPAAPASTAPPAELGGTYTDPNRRFQVGILKNYKVTPLAGSVLIEAPNGAIAYTIVPQSQPLGNPIGLIAGYDNSEGLAKIATTVFQRGEGFQPSPARLEAGGGAVMDWTGALTIGGNPQPVRGVILIRPSSQYILLLLIAATQSGEAQVPSALSALAASLGPMQ